MLDKLYENIGGKIKNWAKWIFIVEAIGSIITAIALPIASGDPNDFILISLLIAIFGPIVAYNSSWILYAFEISSSVSIFSFDSVISICNVSSELINQLKDFFTNIDSKILPVIKLIVKTIINIHFFTIIYHH